MRARAQLIKDVYSLVRKKTSSDNVQKASQHHERLIAEADFMVFLILVANAFKNEIGVLS